MPLGAHNAATRRNESRRPPAFDDKLCKRRDDRSRIAADLRAVISLSSGDERDGHPERSVDCLGRRLVIVDVRRRIGPCR